MSGSTKPGVGTQTLGLLLPHISYPWTVIRKAVPAKILGETHTVSPTNGEAFRPEETDPLLIIEGAGAVLKQIEEAAHEKVDALSRETCLAFHEGRNQLTGESGIIVRRLLRPERYSHALAELMSPSGQLTEETKNERVQLGWNAANRQLQILLYEGIGAANGQPTAFAAIPDPDDSKKLWLLARILVTPFEISQWSDPLAEMPVDSVN